MRLVDLLGRELEVGRELLEGRRRRVDLGPEIGSEETVGSGDSSVSGLDEVTHANYR